MKKVATEFGDTRGNWMNDSVTTRSGECVFAIGTYAIAKTGILTQTQNNSLIVLIGY